MNISRFLQEYRALLNPKFVMLSRSRSKVKSHPYPFRDVAEFVITRHARVRMQKRQVDIDDVTLILQHGRALLRQKGNRSVVYIFLCPGELPKGKTEEKMFAKLLGIVLVTAVQQPVLITVLTDCFRWRSHIFRKPTLPGIAAYHFPIDQEN